MNIASIDSYTYNPDMNTTTSKYFISLKQNDYNHLFIYNRTSIAEDATTVIQFPTIAETGEAAAFQKVPPSDYQESVLDADFQMILKVPKSSTSKSSKLTRKVLPSAIEWPLGHYT